MKTLAVLLWSEVQSTVRRPSRLRKLLSPRDVASFLRFRRIQAATGAHWKESAEGLSTRQMRSYESYTELQSMKVDYVDLAGHEARFQHRLAERLRDLDFIAPGCSVLCLGARLGAEVRAFIDCGCFAVGIDLNPGTANQHVLVGDFQRLQFANNSVDVLYSNSLDHSFDLSQMVEEMGRVLKDNGRVIIEADPGTDESDAAPPDLWQTISWPSVDKLTETLEGLGLELDQRRRFDYPRGGEQLVFQIDERRRVNKTEESSSHR